MRNKFVIILLLALTLLFSACGSPEPSQPPAEPPVQEPPAGEGETPPEATTEPVAEPNAFDPAVYAEILSTYSQAYANQYFGSDMEKCGDINPELCYGNDDPLYYALIDLSADSVPELFIAAKSEDEFRIFDIWGYNGQETQRLFDIASMGYRAIYTVCENNIIHVSGSGGAAYHSDAYYTLPALSVTPGLLETVIYNGEAANPYTRQAADGTETPLSESEAQALLAAYTPSTALEWLILE